MSRYGCDILNLEWASRGRDIDIVEPVLSYLEMKYDLKIVRDSIFNAGWKLLKHRPRVFLIADQGGADVNFEAVRLASKMGIRVVTLRSEGMFPDDAESVERMFWGWNTDRRLYETLHLEWCERNVELFHRFVPESRDYDIRVSGATGFDRYNFMPMETREHFLERRGLPAFERIVGLAGWAFSHVAGKYFENFRDVVTAECGGPDGVAFHRAALPRLREEYRALVGSHPQTLFVARYHPGETEEEHAEFTELEGFPNVVFSRRNDDNVADLISASDLWIAYESTTCLEAWLLGTPTLLINPLGGAFKRAAISDGSPVVTMAQDVSQAMAELGKTGGIAMFDELASVRETLIETTIGYADGRNHVRAAAAILDVLGLRRASGAWGVRSVRELLFALRLQALLGLGAGERVHSLKATRRLRAMFDSGEREASRAACGEALRRFHA